METTPQNQTRTERLNPFAFPANTDIQFLLLITAVLCVSLFMYDFLYSAIPVNVAAPILISKACQTAATVAHPQNLSTLLNTQCVAPQERREAAWDLLGVLLLLSVAGIIFWVWPLAKIWRRDLKPFTAENEVKARMLAFLTTLCQEVGLSRVPIFLTDTHSSSSVTFGRQGCYYITIPTTSVMQFQHNLPAFRAIMLHEFSHIRNADIDKTYFARAIGQAFVLVALLPWTIDQFFAFGGFDQLFFTEVGINLGLTVIIYVTLQALLRTREIYADVRASVWDGPNGALTQSLASLHNTRKSPLKRLVAAHPERQVRMQMINDPSGLFFLQLWQALITGIVVSSALENIVWLIDRLHIGQGWWADQLAPFSAGLFFALMIVGTVGVDLWRATFAQYMQGKVLPRIAVLTGCLTLGLLLGQFFSLLALSSGDSYFSNTGLTYFEQAAHLSWWNWSMLLLTWSTLLFLLLLASFSWLRMAAGYWLEVPAGSASPRGVTALVLGIPCIVLSIWAGEFNTFRSTIEFILVHQDFQEGQVLLAGPLYAWYHSLQASDTLTQPLLLVVLALFDALSLLLTNPLTLVLLICVCVLPLTAWFGHKHRSTLTHPTWMYLESSSQPQPLIQVSTSPSRWWSTRIGSIIPGLLLVIIISGIGLGFSSVISSNQQVLTMAPTYPFSNKLVLDDPMHDNSKGYKWDEVTLGGNNPGTTATCGFNKGSYHISRPKNGMLLCAPEAPQLVFQNLTFEARLTITQGEVAAVAVRVNQTTGVGYLFSITTLGEYSLRIMNGPNKTWIILSSGKNMAIKPGLNQANLVAIVANGPSISGYVNGQQLASVQDSTFTSGQIGIFGNGVNGEDVIAANAHVWQL